jgi:hypothetical protein
MSEYVLPAIPAPAAPPKNEAVLIASGDLRPAANKVCWPAQRDMEERLAGALAKEGWRVRRGHPFDERAGHGFIDSQRRGMEVFRWIHPSAPLIVAEAVWQYSHHVLAGLTTHRGPILSVANWSGQWPGLVGLLNLNGSLLKAGVRHSSLWSEDFTDTFFRRGIREWLSEGAVEHDRSHIRELAHLRLPEPEARLGRALARQLRAEKAILGVFDEGCMGMFNAIIPDHLLHPTGVFKERLSQSALYAKMQEVPDEEPLAARRWLDERGMRFVTGPDAEKDLTDGQVLEQLKMYIAAVRIAHAFGCDAIGIQYQQGLKDLCPASDLAEGLLNNVERPPVNDPESGDELYAGRALPHFNEVDEGAGLDALVTNRVWCAMGFDPETTLHDLRWGQHYKGDGVDDYVWVFLISGAAPPQHFIDGYRGASSERQPPMYFRLGGGTLKGISKAGEIVWSRVFVAGGELHADIGRARAVSLPREETERRWRSTTPQWPILHAVLNGVSRDQMMARHPSNHIQVAYAPSADEANRALWAKAAMFQEMGLRVHLAGTGHGLGS